MRTILRSCLLTRVKGLTALTRFAALALFACALPLRAQTITTRTLDFGSGPNGDTGAYTSQEIVNGTPAIAYFNSTEGNLMFARNSAVDGTGTWTITTVDYVGSTGFFCSLEVVDGNPAISYYDSTNGDLKYVRALDASGTNWGTPVTVDSTGSVGQYSSLAVVAGHPAISYQDSTNNDLKYVRALDATGATWGVPLTVDNAGIVGQYSSLLVVNGNPAIGYLDNTNSDSKYVRATDATGAAWGTPVTVESTGSPGIYLSMAIVNGRPAMAYLENAAALLKFVRASDADGAAWGTSVTAAASASPGLFNSLAVIDGNPAISYYENITTDLTYVRATNVDGTAWGTPATIAASAGQVGRYSSLLMVDGRPAVSYYDTTNGDLNYIRATTASGTLAGDWAAPTTVDAGVQSGNVGQYTSQAIVNGHPAIAYYDVTNQDLKYVRALNAAGTSWGTPVTLDSTGNVGQHTSLAVVDGNPAISYYDGTNQDLKYVRANTASGTLAGDWGTPVTLDSTGNVGFYTSLVVVDGNPAISYYDAINTDLKYVRANTASGTLAGDWGTPVTLDSTGNVGFYASLAVVNGNPAISYYDGTNTNLKYVRANTASGTLAGDWGTPVTLDSTGTVGQYTSLVVVNGHPAISYFDGTNTNLKYVRATTASGTLAGDWGAPVTLDSTGQVGSFTSLAVVDGNPAISYYDVTNLDLKYVRANTASGTLAGDWGTPVTLDSTGSVGQYTSLAVVNGNAAISYYDNTNTNLKWATYVAVVTAPDIAVAQAAAVADGGSVGFGSQTVGVSGTPLTFTITNPGTADLSGLAVTGGTGEFSVSALSATTVTPGGPGATFTVTFTPSATGARGTTLDIASNVTGAKNPYSLVLAGTGTAIPQTISFTNPGGKTYGDAPFGLVATGGGSGNAVTFAIVSGPATVSGSTLTITGAGSVTVRASQAGNASYAAAADVEQTFNVAMAAQAISFTNPGARTFGDAPFGLVATGGGSGNAVTFAIVSGPATVSGSTLTITGAGDVTVRASQLGNGNYFAAPDVDATFTVAKAAQAITFTNPGARTFGDAPFALSATGGGSGNAVTFAIVSGPATVSGSTLTITGAGDVTVRASQLGNADYFDAADVDRTFTVAKAAQAITFTNPGAHTFGDAPFALSATGGGSGNAVTFAIVSGPATVSGSTLTITGAGSVTVRASQLGDANYFDAADVDQTFSVAAAGQTITFNLAATASVLDTIVLSATGGASGNPVTFAVQSGPGTIGAGDVLSFTGEGSVVVRASQAGNTNYNPAADVDRTIVVSKASQTISFSLAGTAVTTDTIALSATATSGLAVSFNVQSGPGSITGNSLTFTGAGSVVVRASQAGDTNYAAAADVDRTIVVSATGLTLVDDTAFAGSTAITINVLGNDTTESGTLSITSITQPASGGVAAIVAGKVKFTPAGAVAAPITFTYTATNGSVSATATVTVRSSSTTPGSYVGLLKRPNGEVRGRFAMTVTAGGVATGNLKREGMTWIFKASVVSGNVAFAKSPNPPPSGVTLMGGDLDADNKPTFVVTVPDTVPNQKITGTIERSPAAATQAGRYTLIADSATAPRTGAAMYCTIGATGTATFGGKLGTGTVVTQSAKVLSGGRLPFYLASGNGATFRKLAGEIVFDRTVSPAVSGTLHWTVPAGLDARLPAGVDRDYDALGVAYTAGATAAQMFNPAAPVATLTLGFTAPVTRLVSMTGTPIGGWSKRTFSSNKGFIEMAPGSGYFRGLHIPVAKIGYSFFGVVLQDSSINIGRGVVLDAGALREVSFTP